MFKRFEQLTGPSVKDSSDPIDSTTDYVRVVITRSNAQSETVIPFFDVETE